MAALYVVGTAVEETKLEINSKIFIDFFILF